jgi:PhzF family phenazine biosynthesis protein
MRIFQVDAFTPEPFRGNPAAVCLLDGAADERWMQAVAAEMNLSETAFLQRSPDGYDLRWFTPVTEVDLCGHATLAAAHVLWEAGEARPGDVLYFETRSGTLTAEATPKGVRLDFPATPPEALDPEAAAEASAKVAAIQSGLAKALGAVPVYVGRSRFDYLVELFEEAAVRDLHPDLPALRPLTRRGVIVTARADADREYDFVSRFFSPSVGIDEDPVTGSAHCCLGPYWSLRTGAATLRGYQASARGGFVDVEVSGDRVFLTGQAVTVLRGEIL